MATRNPARRPGIPAHKQGTGAKEKPRKPAPAEFLKEWQASNPTAVQGEITSELGRVNAIEAQEQALLRFGNPVSGRNLINQLVPREVEGGTEHRVFGTPDGERVVKLTHPGRYGFMRDTPADYLTRLANLQSIAPDLDLRIEGVTKDGSFSPIITSMKKIEGRHPDAEELHAKLVGRGWVEIPGEVLAYKHNPSGVVMADAHSGNFVVTPSGKLVPIDIAVYNVPAGAVALFAASSE